LDGACLLYDWLAGWLILAGWIVGKLSDLSGLKVGRGGELVDCLGA